MPGKIGIQFYALSDEITNILASVIDRTDCDSFFYRELRQGTYRFSDGLPRIPEEASSFVFIGRSDKLPREFTAGELDAKTTLDDYCIRVHSGGTTPKGLAQSFFSYSGRPDWLHADATTISRQIKKNTSTGIRIGHADGSPAQASRVLRFTEGAQRSYRQGTRLLLGSDALLAEIPDSD